MRYKFHEKNHIYEHPDQIENISVSTLIGNYKQKFDGDFWTEWKAWEEILFPMDNKEVRKNRFRALRKSWGLGGKVDTASRKLFNKLESTYPNLMQDVKQDIKKRISKEWEVENKKSTDKGSEYHEFKEKESIARGWEINPFTGNKLNVIVPYIWENGVKVSNVDLLNLKDGYYPEIIVYFDGIFGQIDKLWVENRTLYIRDYKTNKDVKLTNPFQRMKYPLEHLEDCNGMHYYLQLNLYMYLLMKYDYEYGDIAIDWYNKSIPVPRMTREIEDMLMDWKYKNLI